MNATRVHLERGSRIFLCIIAIKSNVSGEDIGIAELVKLRFIGLQVNTIPATAGIGIWNRIEEIVQTVPPDDNWSFQSSVRIHLIQGVDTSDRCFPG